LATQLGVKVIAMLEGGYSLQALEESVPLTVRGLLGLPIAPHELTLDENPLSVDKHIDAVRRRHAHHWKCLKKAA
jgi:acetoin utilization deacetylase AcuC-like enzyme